MEFFRVKPDCVELYVKVTPGASKTAVKGVKDGRLCVRVAAAPEDGKANACLLAFLAKTLALPKSALAVKTGATSRLKTVTFPPSAETAVAALGAV